MAWITSELATACAEEALEVSGRAAATEAEMRLVLQPRPHSCASLWEIPTAAVS